MTDYVGINLALLSQEETGFLFAMKNKEYQSFLGWYRTYKQSVPKGGLRFGQAFYNSMQWKEIDGLMINDKLSWRHRRVLDQLHAAEWGPAVQLISQYIRIDE